jgi:UDP-N-acetylmuramyl pentapeptide synthase
MATSLTTTIALAISAAYANSLDVGSVGYPLTFNPSYNFQDGVGANQAKTLFSDIRTIAPSGTDDLDLSGVLTDAFGLVMSATKVKAIIVIADAANVNDVVVGGAAANQFLTPFGSATDKVKVKPGGLFAIVAPDVNGYAVTAATGDLLRIANSAAGTSVNYTIIIIAI